MASRLVWGFHQQEVDVHYLLILLIAVTVSLMNFSHTACDAAPLPDMSELQENHPPPSGSLRRTERSVTDYVDSFLGSVVDEALAPISSLFSADKNSSPGRTGSSGARTAAPDNGVRTRTPEPDVWTPAPDSNLDNTHRNRGRTSQPEPLSPNRDIGNAGSSDTNSGTGSGTPDRTNQPDAGSASGDSGSGVSGGGSGSRARPPPVRDSNVSSNESSGLTGNKWLDLIINSALGGLGGANDGSNSGTSGDTTGNDGGGITNTIVKAVAAAAVQHILAGVLG